MMKVGDTLLLSSIEERTSPPGTSIVGRSDRCIQYLNVPGINKPSTFYHLRIPPHMTVQYSQLPAVPGHIQQPP